MVDKIIKLTNLLNTYRHEYYNLNNPSVSDTEYDRLFNELKTLENKVGFSLSNSPTKTVGYEVISKLKKRKHPTPLLSLDKTKSIDELNKWRKGKDIILMLKADGLTIELDYDNGKFIGGYTRGNGEEGEVVSHNCKVFKNIPLSIPFKGKLRLAGEAIIHWDDFKKINSNLSDEDKYKTPRNLAAGSVRQLNSEVCFKRNVYFYSFNILECEEILEDSKFRRCNWLHNLGFTPIPTILLPKDRDIENSINELKQQAQKRNIPIDGIVASFDSVNYSNSLKSTSHHPLHSIGYKFDDVAEQTTLRNIRWNTTRTGQITPTAIFDEVIIDGTSVGRASLHNLSFIENLQLNIGCRILVTKRNLIIPHVEDNLDRDKGLLEFPRQCPSCNGNTEIKNTGTANFLFCTNENCSAKMLDRFINFVKRDAMNIEGLSEATLEKFISKGWLKIFSDIYELDKYKTEIIKMEGFGLKSYDRLWESIQKSKSVKLENFIVALGIPGIGRSASKIIAKTFNNDWFNFEYHLQSGYDFTQLEGFGDITNDNLHKWYDNMMEFNLWNKLTVVLNFIQKEKEGNNLKDLSGMTFVITGSVNTFKNRDEFKELVESLNGKVSSSVSSKTSYLVNNDVSSDTGKNKKAKSLGIEIISEDDFNKMIGREV